MALSDDITKAPSTGLSTNEALIDLYMERAVDLLRVESGTRDKIAVLLNDLERELVKQIADIDPTGTARLAYQKARMAKLLDAVRATIKATYRTADLKLSSEVRELIDIEATWTGNAINAAMHLEFVDAGLSRKQLETLTSDVLIDGAPTAEWWGRQSDYVTTRFADEMRKGVALGETNADLIARIRGTSAQRGLMDISRASAERLVRSSVQTAANTAREAVYADNSDLIASLMWHATLDTRTSIWCITRDGHHYANDDDHKPKDGGPPWLQGPGKLHWGCRSTSVPILKSWRDLGIDEDEVPDTTRVSMDGQVAADTSFESWLKKQSQTRQDTVLGAGKADLWRNGKITFRDLLDQNGRPLTTEDLRAKAARK